MGSSTARNSLELNPGTHHENIKRDEIININGTKKPREINEIIKYKENDPKPSMACENTIGVKEPAEFCASSASQIPALSKVHSLMQMQIEKSCGTKNGDTEPNSKNNEIPLPAEAQINVNSNSKLSEICTAYENATANTIKESEPKSNCSLFDSIKQFTQVLESKSLDSINSKENDKKLENEMSLKSNQNKKPHSTKKRLPVIISYPARQRPRQPFYNQMPNQSNVPARVPHPPPYYTSTVTEDQHQPQQLMRTSSLRETGTPSGVISTQRNTSQEPPVTNQPRPLRDQEIRYTPFSNFQPGQMMMMPNAFMNISYWAPYPQNIPSNVPACLAHLVAADSLFIIQQMDMIELFLNISEPNFYLIQNTSGQCLYYAYETTNLCIQDCCKSTRGFQLHVMDMYHNEIIYMNKPCGCNNYFCCYPVMEVYSPPLVPVGAIMQKFNLTKNEFSIIDADENKMFKIHGPCCCFTMGCCEVDFTIHALDWEETEVGVIRRQWGNYVTSMFTNTDYYGITFPVDIDVRIKAVFLGALFLIEYSFYDN